MDITIAGVSGVIILEVVVKAIKQFSNNHDWLPVVNLAGGIVLGLLALKFGVIQGNLLTASVQGLLVGAATAGLYQFRKDTLNLTV